MKKLITFVFVGTMFFSISTLALEEISDQDDIITDIQLEEKNIDQDMVNEEIIFIDEDYLNSLKEENEDVLLFLENQKAIGHIDLEKISLIIDLKNQSIFEGSIDEINEDKKVLLSLSEDSILNLTGDCYLTDLEDEDLSLSNIHLNGYHLFVNGIEIKIENVSEEEKGESEEQEIDEKEALVEKEEQTIDSVTEMETDMKVKSLKDHSSQNKKE